MVKDTYTAQRSLRLEACWNRGGRVIFVTISLSISPTARSSLLWAVVCDRYGSFGTTAEPPINTVLYYLENQ